MNAARPNEIVHSAIAVSPVKGENRIMRNVSEHLVMRAADPADAGAICAIYNAAIIERGSTFETELRSTEGFSERIKAKRFPFLVAEANGEVIGWAGLVPYSDRPCYAGIGECSIYVTVESRGKGVGTALTETLAVEAERNGFHKLLGKLFTDNAASIRLVEKMRFSSVGVHRNHGQLDGNWRDVLVVERLLGGAATGS
jgi:L-amino acid N-acyltransferase YncA